MSDGVRDVPRDHLGVAGRIIRAACLLIAILSGVLLVAPGLYWLGLWVVLSGFREVMRNFRLGPPSPPTATEIANEARNAAEMAGMFRQSVAMIGMGVAALLICGVVSRGARSLLVRPDRPD